MNGVVLKKAEPAFVDDRGQIFDLFEEPVHHVGLITFTKGAVRAKHYHKQSVQYTYVLEGTIELIVYPNGQPEKQEVMEMAPGAIVSIDPGIVHTYRAKTDARILDLTTLSRADNGYEDDVVRVEVNV
jgi:quercetin dioxygenase-like cupin family protein